jgi:hypothetical protein
MRLDFEILPVEGQHLPYADTRDEGIQQIERVQTGQAQREQQFI